jgi:sugar phosphate isomerase/epimerase
MKIGIRLESLGLPLRSALSQAAQMGIKGVQIDAIGDLSPERLTDTGRRELRNLLKTFDLSLTALNCPLRRGIDVNENQDARLEHVRNTLSLAFELGPRLAIVQCPRIAGEPDSPRAKLMREALLDLGRHGDRCGSALALEIGFDPAEKVRDYLNQFDVGGLGVNYDPANLLLRGHDPLKNLVPLKGKVLHVNARDARVNSVSHAAAEVPLGAGDIDWLSFAGSLSAIEYRGWVVVKRESGASRVADVASGVKLLRRMIV